MQIAHRITRFASRACLLLLGILIASPSWAEPRTMGIASNWGEFFKSVSPVITELNPGESVGQTIFATGSGTITEFEFGYNGGNFELTVYEGEGRGGTQLHSQLGTTAAGSTCQMTPCVVRFSKPIPVTGGRYYTLIITNRYSDMRGIYSTRSDAYKDGRRLIFRPGYLHADAEVDLYFAVRGDLTGQIAAPQPMEILTSAPAFNELKLNPGESVAQSFVSPGTGSFDRLHLSVDGRFDVAFHAGEGHQGTLLDSQSVTFANSFAELTRRVAVQAGQQYTFVLTNRNADARIVGETTGNGYAWGRKLLRVDPYSIEFDIAFRLRGRATAFVQPPAAHPVPTYNPYRAASGPLTLMNCEAAEIVVGTFNSNDTAMLVPYRTYRLAPGASSALVCNTPTCKLKVGNVKTDALSGYQVFARGVGRATHPEAMAAGCRLYAKYP